ncbi:MAG TPA: MBL fold metallo-hydrolase [Pseudonocardiaceae bacterium]|jgi:ribonuclease J|nr:MBL fold metallo-hydrolase [Pseudonocardiaceae bacterium]
MASIEFWGGLGVIGSSKVMIDDGINRVLLDIGLDNPVGADLFRPPVRSRKGRELADRLRVGAAPRIPGLFEPALLDRDDPIAEPVGDPAATEVFVSHPHLDHAGLAGYVRREIAVHAHTDAVDLLDALEAAGIGLPSGHPRWRRLVDGQVVSVGNIDVQCVAVDHDVAGACGFLVHTKDGTLAYTGDFRFHGRHPERSEEFVRRARGADVLVTEGTTLSFVPGEGPQRSERDVLDSFTRIIGGADGLVLISLYPMDTERIAEFSSAAAAAGRTILWPAPLAAALRGLGMTEATNLATETHEGVDLAAVHAKPAAFIIQPDPADLPGLLDLPLRAGDAFVHANGEPLGEFDPRWRVFRDWLACLRVELHEIGAGGHASPDELHAMVERIRPTVVFPVHTFEPTRLSPALGIRRVVARYGTRYSFSGSVILD